LIAYLGSIPISSRQMRPVYLTQSQSDGSVFAKHSGGNANGVDLNQLGRQLAKDWAPPAVDPKSQCRREGAGSEPETQVLMAFIQAHQFEAIINYHSAALGVFAGGLPPDDYSIHLAQAIAAVSTYRYPPIDTGCEYTGGFTDWANEQNIAAVDVELTDHTHTDFDMNLRILMVFLNWKR
jgi:hypothetical protein